jgi:excisionase family DNA binding protein
MAICRLVPWRSLAREASQEFAVLDDRWLSVDEVAEYLGVSKDTVYAWVTNKGMPGYKVGRFWKFKRDDVDAWVRDGGAASGSDEELNEKSSHE